MHSGVIEVIRPSPSASGRLNFLKTSKRLFKAWNIEVRSWNVKTIILWWLTRFAFASATATALTEFAAASSGAASTPLILPALPPGAGFAQSIGEVDPHLPVWQCPYTFLSLLTNNIWKSFKIYPSIRQFLLGSGNGDISRIKISRMIDFRGAHTWCSVWCCLFAIGWC